MVKLCIVKSCPSGRKKMKKTKSAPISLSFFQPRSQTKLENWSKSLGLKLKPTDYICHHHFKADDIKFYETIKIGDIVYLSYLDKKLLKEDAIPTIKHQFKIKLQKDLVHMPLKQVDEQQVLSSEQQLSDSTDSDEDKGYYVEQQPSQGDEKFEKSLQKYKQQQCHKYDEVTPEDDEQTLVDFKNQMIDAIILPPYWFYVEKPKQIDFMRVDPKSEQIKHRIRLNEDLSTTVVYANKEEFNFNNKLKSVNDVYNYLKFVEKWPVCVGTQIEKIMYSKKCKGVIVGEEAYKRLQINPRCKACRVLRSRFQSRPFARLTTIERLTAQKRRIQTLEKQCKRLKLMVDKFKDPKLPKIEPEVINFKTLLNKTNKYVKAESNDEDVEYRREEDEEISDDVMLVNDGKVISYYEIKLNSNEVVSKEEAVGDVDFIDNYEVPGDEVEISHKDDKMSNNEVGDKIFFEFIKNYSDDKDDGIDEDEENYSKSISESDDEGKLKCKLITCEKCGMILNGVNEYRRHLTSNHGVDGKQFLMEKFICEHCGKGYTCNSLLEEHITTHGEDRCGKSYPTRRRLSPTI